MIHFVIDSYGCDSSRTNNLRDVYEVIAKLVNTFQLKPIMPPQLVPYYYCEQPEDVGISAFILLKGGHFTIHTFPEWGCYFADLLVEEDSFINKKTLEKFLKNEFPCDTLIVIPVYRDEFDKMDLGEYKSEDFGPHYMLSATLEKGEPFTVDSMMRLLDTLPPRVGMHPINRPVVLYDTVDNPTYLSGIALIAESHIAIHYNLAEKKILMDVFSCKRIEPSKYEIVKQEIFKDNKVDEKLVRRGRSNQDRKDNNVLKYDVHKKWQEVINGKDKH